MASVAPGDITIQPGTKVVFNAPYDDKHTYHIKVINSGGCPFGCALKATNMKRLEVDLSCEVLDSKETVSCDCFVYGKEDTKNDHITIEWPNASDYVAKPFRREWFQGDGIASRKHFPIEYIP